MKGDTPLIVAVRQQTIEQLPIEVPWVQSEDRPEAVQKRRKAIAKQLLIAGANPNTQNHLRRTAIDYARIQPQLEYVQLLESHGR